jgi:hypothetical protein
MLSGQLVEFEAAVQRTDRTDYGTITDMLENTKGV